MNWCSRRGSREWRCARELGVIAGTRPLGLGRFFARFDEDCDGTIAVSETKLPGHTAHVTLPVSHMGMLALGRRRRPGGRVPRQWPLRGPPNYWNLKRSSCSELSFSLMVSLRHPVQLELVCQL